MKESLPEPRYVCIRHGVFMDSAGLASDFAAMLAKWDENLRASLPEIPSPPRWRAVHVGPFAQLTTCDLSVSAGWRPVDVEPLIKRLEQVRESVFRQLP